MIDIYTFIEAVWILWPAYGANGLCMLSRGKYPIDGGKTFRGKQILGPGKTWEGLFTGAFIGMLIATFQMFMFPLLPWDLSPVQLNILPMSPLIGLVIGFGVMIGDLVGSIIKRRIGLARGKPAPLLDQLDFIVGMLVLLSFVAVLKWEWVVILLIITPVIHIIANRIAYIIKLKNVPY
ncbi:MAG: CDP-2,3-bis-(O-geranylgeranyl)-sn-glycerol synthase [Candidatus Aenigmarchaeota archaeon]|nr:CDP-2,3-bis-(O-geranylgeranyl)-sn-glycerol synthase [Candidatus Aenigmarchaeota archaeon]